MINATTAFRQELANGNRDYKEKVRITLADGTVLDLTNEHIWNGGFSFDDAVSNDSYLEIGAAICNKFTVVINNITDNFSPYDFTGAEVIPSVGLYIESLDETHYIQKGVFTVDTATYNGSLITLTCLDRMTRFDKPANLSLFTGGDITALQMIDLACNECNVSRSGNFPNSYLVLSEPDDKTSLTWRDVVSYTAQLCGCFARMNNAGLLKIDWFPFSELEAESRWLNGGLFDENDPNTYTSGDAADGGSFSPWNKGYIIDAGRFEDSGHVHYLPSTFSKNIGVDDVYITGIRITVPNTTDTSPGESHEGNITVTYTEDVISAIYGDEGYVLVIEDNPFISNANIRNILLNIFGMIVGAIYRQANITHLSDPTIEAGDVAIAFDKNRNAMPIIVSRTAFSVGSSQTTISAAETPARNLAAGYGAQTRNLIKYRKLIEQSVNDVYSELTDKIADSTGLYPTRVSMGEGHGENFYLHDQPNLSDSTIVWRQSAGAWSVTSSYITNESGVEEPTKQQVEAWDTATSEAGNWNAGITVDGKSVMKILQTEKISADLITSGILNADRIYGGKIILGYNYDRAKEAAIQRAAEELYDSFLGINYGWSIEECREIVEKDYKSWIYDYQSDYDPAFEMELVAQNYNGKTFLKINRDGFCHGDQNWLASQAYHFSGGDFVVQEGQLGLIEFKQDGSLIFNTDPNSEEIFLEDGWLSVNASRKHIETQGSLKVYGQKNRIFKTEDYGDRLLYSYETPTPYFGDIGEAIINEDGFCYIAIGSVFSETISTDEYQVFLQKYGEGDCYVKERKPSHFVVAGTPNLSFGWEIKAKQKDGTQFRLDRHRRD